VAHDGTSCPSLGGSNTDLIRVIIPFLMVNAKIAVGWPFRTTSTPASPRTRMGRRMAPRPPALPSRARVATSLAPCTTAGLVDNPPRYSYYEIIFLL